MSIDEAKEEFDFFNEGDYITREMVIAKDIVLKKLHETESDLYEANNRIADLLLILGDRDRMIDLMLDTLIGLDSDVEIVRKIASINTKEKKEHLLEIYEKRCKDAKDWLWRNG